jgi:hypothetical protein
MLATYATQLEHALASGLAGPERLAALLTGLELGLSVHARQLFSSGLLDDADRAVATLDRRQRTVERTLGSLRLEKARLCQAVGYDFSASDDVCRRVGSLAEGLRRLAEDEARLVLDAAYAESGGGD